MHLAFDDHRVDASPTVINSDEAAHLDLTGQRIYVNNADVATVGVGEIRRVVDRGGVEMTLNAFWQFE